MRVTGGHSTICARRQVTPEPPVPLRRIGSGYCPSSASISRTRTRPATDQLPGCPVRPPARRRSHAASAGVRYGSASLASATSRTRPSGRQRSPRGHAGSEARCPDAGPDAALGRHLPSRTAGAATSAPATHATGPAGRPTSGQGIRPGTGAGPAHSSIVGPVNRSRTKSVSVISYTFGTGTHRRPDASSTALPAPSVPLADNAAEPWTRPGHARQRPAPAPSTPCGAVCPDGTPAANRADVAWCGTGARLTDDHGVTHAGEAGVQWRRLDCSVAIGAGTLKRLLVEM
jgi:hypothetical protein